MKELLLKAKKAVRGGETLENWWFFISEGFVMASGGGEPPSLPEKTPKIEADLVSEPLLDAHVHLFLSGSFDSSERELTAALSREEALARIMKILEDYKKAGIWAVRDGGDPQGLALEASALASENPERYARVFPSAGPFYKRGFYGSFLGHAVDDPSEALPLIEKMAARGATQIKVIATGLNSLQKAGETGPNPFSASEMELWREISLKSGLPLMMHANGPLQVPLVASPLTVEHGFWMEEGDEKRLRESGAAFTPTTVAWSSLLRHPSLTEEQKSVVAKTAARHEEETRLCIEAGVPVLAGSDAGTPGVSHVEGFFREAEALMKLGLSFGEMLAGQKIIAPEFTCLRDGKEAGFVVIEKGGNNLTYYFNKLTTTIWNNDERS